MSSALRDVADWVSKHLAQQALSNPAIERALIAGCRNAETRRRLHLGGVALAYARVLDRPELRISDLDGYRMYVDLAEYYGVMSFFFRDKLAVWPTPMLVPSGGICADVGANAGIYTFLFGSLVGPHGRVFAFEPNPRCASMLERSIALNGWADRVRLDRRAVSDVPDEHLRLFLSMNPNNSGTSSLVNHGVYVDEAHTIQTATTTLDTYFRDAGIEHLSVLKIDVERAEDRVARGAAGLLGSRHVDYLIVEMLAGGDAQRIVEAHGYRWFLIDETHTQLVPVSRVAPGHFGDFLAVSPASQSAFEDRLGKFVR